MTKAEAAGRPMAIVRGIYGETLVIEMPDGSIRYVRARNAKARLGDVEAGT